jgi:hypothetical protein
MPTSKRSVRFWPCRQVRFEARFRSQVLFICYFLYKNIGGSFYLPLLFQNMGNFENQCYDYFLGIGFFIIRQKMHYYQFFLKEVQNYNIGPRVHWYCTALLTIWTRSSRSCLESRPRKKALGSLRAHGIWLDLPWTLSMSRTWLQQNFRVTRWGEFSTFGRVSTFFKITEVSQNFGLLYPQ